MYKIGSFVFNVQYKDMNIPENFNKFIYHEDMDTYYNYQIDVTNCIEIHESKFNINKSTIKIVFNQQLEKRYLFLQGDIQPYAVCEEIDSNHTRILIHRDYLSYMYIDTMFVSLLSLERRMNNFHEYILHSSYMVVNNQAVLFTAPSGTGKSTQADLWKKYQNASIINGDRTLISKKMNNFYANGWPICGSSEICLNESYPISAIVFLMQGKVNKIEKIPYQVSIKKFLQEITINYHNSEFVQNVLDFIDDVLRNIPVYQLTCDISEDAVKCLEKQLYEDNIWMH